jgi:hypothetical protein
MQFDNVKSYGDPNNMSNQNCDNRFMMQQHQRFDQLKSNQMNHPMSRDNSFQMSMDRRNMRSIYEPDLKRRAFDTGFNTPTTFTFAGNNASNQLLVTNALNHQLHNSTQANTSNADTNSQTAQTAALAAVAAAAAINSGLANGTINGSNASTSSTANTITRSVYNLNEQRFLIEENNAFRRKIDELKQQVVDLMNANEFLLEQNAQLRNSLLPATSVNQKLNVTTTLHNPVNALHSNTTVVQKSSNNPVVVPTSSQPSSLPALSHINPTISSADLLVANHLHRQNQQINQQRAVVASATSSALSSMSTNMSTNLSNPLSVASSISLTSTSTSAPLVSYPIPHQTASIPHSLGHLTH